MTDEAKKLLVRLQRQCVRRECCVSDIRRKVETALGAGADAEEVVKSLVEDKFVDDLRYASAFAREKSGISGWGPIKIRYALGRKAVAREDIDAALAGIDTFRADDRLAKLLAAKARTLEGDPQARLKLIRFALTRGYDYPAVQEALKQLSK